MCVSPGVETLDSRRHKLGKPWISRICAMKELVLPVTMDWKRRRRKKEIRRVANVNEDLSFWRRKWGKRQRNDFAQRTNDKMGEQTLGPLTESTMGQNRKKLRVNSHPIIHCLTSSEVGEVSERANEWAQRSARAVRAGRSKLNEWAVRANKQTDEQVI